MSVLCIDGRDIAHIGVGIAENGGDVWTFADYTVHDARPEDFLRIVTESLTPSMLPFTAIVAITGPGSATALRTSLATVNTIAFARNLSLYGFAYDGVDAEGAFCDFLSRPRSLTFPLLLPVYANAPNITESKKDALRRTL